jgi:hypothetical protein
MRYATRRLAGVAILLCFAGAAAAQDSGQDKPTVPPVADKGTTAQINCVDEKGETTGSYRHYLRRVELTNKCEQRLKCDVYAAAFGAQGLQKGRTTMVLEPKSKGAAATKTYQFRIKEAGGMLSSSRHCRVF